MKLRLLVAAAVAVGSIVVGAGPASATCNPEKPSTCEFDWEQVRRLIPQ